MITDKLASYVPTKREVVPGVEHRRHKGSNSRAENSHQPTRRCERPMKRFELPGHALRFLSAHGGINNLFHLRRDHLPAASIAQANASSSDGGFGLEIAGGAVTAALNLVAAL